MFVSLLFVSSSTINTLHVFIVHELLFFDKKYSREHPTEDFLYYYVKKEERRGWRRGRARCWRPEDEDSFRRFFGVLFLEARTNAKHVDDAAFV